MGCGKERKGERKAAELDRNPLAGAAEACSWKSRKSWLPARFKGIGSSSTLGANRESAPPAFSWPNSTSRQRKPGSANPPGGCRPPPKGSRPAPPRPGKGGPPWRSSPYWRRRLSMRTWKRSRCCQSASRSRRWHSCRPWRLRAWLTQRWEERTNSRASSSFSSSKLLNCCNTAPPSPGPGGLAQASGGSRAGDVVASNPQARAWPGSLSRPGTRREPRGDRGCCPGRGVAMARCPPGQSSGRRQAAGTALKN